MTEALIAIYCLFAIINHALAAKRRKAREAMDAVRDAEIKQLQAKVAAIETAIQSTPFINYN